MLSARILVVAVLAALVCGHVTVADVRVFVTSSADGYGLDLIGPDGDGTGTDPEHDDWPIDPFRPTYSTVDLDGYDDYAFDYTYGYYRAAAYPPIAAPSGSIENPILIDVSGGEWGYIWFQFRNEFSGATVHALNTEARVAGQADPTDDLDFTYYVQNDIHGNSSVKRWSGSATPPDYPEWDDNPFLVFATVTIGIRNMVDTPWNMFDNQATDGDSRTGVALLGAVSGEVSEEVYELKITQIGYTEPPYPDIGESCYFQFIPEPGSLVLCVLLALSLRRNG